MKNIKTNSSFSEASPTAHHLKMITVGTVTGTIMEMLKFHVRGKLHSSNTFLHGNNFNVFVKWLKARYGKHLTNIYIRILPQWINHSTLAQFYFLFFSYISRTLGKARFTFLEFADILQLKVFTEGIFHFSFYHSIHQRILSTDRKTAFLWKKLSVFKDMYCNWKKKTLIKHFNMFCMFSFHKSERRNVIGA